MSEANVKQSPGGIAIPEWTHDELLTTAPYEWLARFSQNRFLQTQLLERLSDYAMGQKVRNVKGQWRAYCAIQKETGSGVTGNATCFDGQPLDLDCGRYLCDDAGIHADFGRGEVEICAHPIMPVRRLINIDTGEVKQEIAFRRGKAWRTAIWDKQVLSSAQKIVSLSSAGVGVDSENAKLLVAYLTAMENLNYDRLPESKSVGRLGWVAGEGFSPYVDGLIFDGDENYRHAFSCVRPEGSEEAWLTLARQARKHGVIARIMMAASFASALVAPLDALPFLLHVWGGSGAGKTVGLMLAASIWANPSVGEYIRTFNSTDVANEMMAAFCGSLPLCLDELQCVGDRSKFDNTIYKLCEGAGKARGAKSGGLQRMTHWRNCTISTGEMPITGNASGAGAVNRVIEIDCRDEKLFEDPRETVAILRKNYGHAGKRLVTFLSQDGAMDSIKSIQQAFAAALEGKATDKQILAASLILTADTLAEMIIFRDGVTLTTDDLSPYLVTSDRADANKRAYGWLCDMVASNPGRFVPIDGKYQGECWGTIEGDWAYIIKSVFDRELRGAGFSPESFLSWSKRTNLLQGDRSQHNTRMKRLPAMEVPARCVCVRIGAEEGGLTDVTGSETLPEGLANA